MDSEFKPTKKHWRNEEILEEAKVEPIVMVMRMRRSECFGHVKRRVKKENIRAIAELKLEGHCQKGHESLERQGGMGREKGNSL